jgi:hypothetical protein
MTSLVNPRAEATTLIFLRIEKAASPAQPAISQTVPTRLKHRGITTTSGKQYAMQAALPPPQARSGASRLLVPLAAQGRAA